MNSFLSGENPPAAATPSKPQLSADHTAILDDFERLIHRDPARRGLISTECSPPKQAEQTARLGAGQLAAAACELAAKARRVAIVTGFFIPHSQPPAAETDGPPGSLFLASCLRGIGIDAIVITDAPCGPALQAAADGIGFPLERVFISPLKAEPWCDEFLQSDFARGLTHLIAVERVGPSHTPESIARQFLASGGREAPDALNPAIAPGNSDAPDAFLNPAITSGDSDASGASRPPFARAFLADVAPEHHNRCHNMRGDCIDAHTAPLHRLFERLPEFRSAAKTIGVGDGGNEIGMGAIPWWELQRRLSGDHAGRVPCRIPCDFNIIAGTSNWGAMVLAAATCLLRDRVDVIKPWTQHRHQAALQHLVTHGPAVDGVTGRREATVDGLPFLTYIQPWAGIRRRLGWSD